MLPTTLYSFRRLLLLLVHLDNFPILSAYVKCLIMYKLSGGRVDAWPNVLWVNRCALRWRFVMRQQLAFSMALSLSAPANLLTNNTHSFHIKAVPWSLSFSIVLSTTQDVLPGNILRICSQFNWQFGLFRWKFVHLPHSEPRRWGWWGRARGLLILRTPSPGGRWLCHKASRYWPVFNWPVYSEGFHHGRCRLPNRTRNELYAYGVRSRLSPGLRTTKWSEHYYATLYSTSFILTMLLYIHSCLFVHLDNYPILSALLSV